MSSSETSVFPMGMVGGGPGSFIGPVHRMAAELDGRIRMVAGAFSQSAEKSRTAGAQYGIAPERAYQSYEEMIARESTREDGIGMIAVVTPNHLHLPVAKAALAAGLHVISDKPATATLAEALDLREAVEASGCQYALTFTYTGYPLIRTVQDLIANGALGTIRKVMVEYLQGWLSEPLERSGQKQAEWRADPARAGIGGCSGDIGVHAFNLLEYVTGLRVQSLCADMRSVVPGRILDDDCTCLAVLNNGAHAIVAASQIATGERNGLRLRVYGEKGGLEWQQEMPNRLSLRWMDGREEIIHAGTAAAGPAAAAGTRLPPGHPEGLIEALANIYREFADSIAATSSGSPGQRSKYLCGIEEGVRSMAFVETAVRGGAGSLRWMPFDKDEKESKS